MRRLPICLSFAGVLLLGGCTPPSPAPPPTEEKAVVPGARYEPSRFVIPAADGSGGNIALEDFRGKVVLLDFWATWCPPCRFELPALNRLHNELKDRGFSVVGMTVDDLELARLTEAVGRFDLAYPVGQAGPGIQQSYGGIRAVPTKFLLDREGAVRKRYEGVVPEKQLRADVEALL